MALAFNGDGHQADLSCMLA